MRLASTVLLLTVIAATSVRADDKDGWVVLFDGKSLDGWKASENKDSWKVEDGALICFGPRSHLFYVGDDKPFKNFELSLDIMTTPGSNSGVYFHTKYQDQGWPKYGFEAQVNNTHGDPKKTASLYAVENVTEAPAEDNKWFTMTIKVEGKKVVISVDGKKLTEYEEPAETKPGKDFTRVFDEGTFALQAHDPKSKVYYKNIRVRRLP
jgi:hypothetical protein